MNKSILLKVGGILLGVLVVGGAIGWFLHTEKKFGGAVSPSGSLWTASSTTGVASSTFSNFPATLGSFACISATGTTIYVQFHNATSGQNIVSAAPLFTFPLFSGQQRVLGEEMFGTGGYRFSTGLTLAISNTTGTMVRAATDAATCTVLTR